MARTLLTWTRWTGLGDACTHTALWLPVGAALPGFKQKALATKSTAPSINRDEEKIQNELSKSTSF